MEDALCPYCKKELKVKTCISETQAIMRCKQCKKNFNITFDEKKFSRKFNTFNWGAFLLGWIWCFGNGKAGLGILLLILGFLGRTPYIGLLFAIPIIIIGIILGVKGNKIAWNNKKWNSVADFEKALKTWNLVGILFTIIIAIITAYTTFYYLNSL